MYLSKDKRKIKHLLKKWYLQRKLFALSDISSRVCLAFFLVLEIAFLFYLLLGFYSAIRVVVWSISLPLFLLLVRRAVWRPFFAGYNPIQLAKEIDLRHNYQGRFVSAVEFIEQQKAEELTDALIADVALEHNGSDQMIRDRTGRRFLLLSVVVILGVLQFIAFKKSTFAVVSYFFGNNFSSTVRDVKVVKQQPAPLLIKNVRFLLRFPTSSVNMPASIKDDNTLSVTSGTIVSFYGVASQALRSASFDKNGLFVPLKVKGNKFWGLVKVDESLQLSFRVRSISGQTNVDPLFYTFLLDGKKKPRITLLAPTKDFIAGRKLLIPLEYGISDDAAMRSVWLEYRIYHDTYTEKGRQKIPNRATGGLINHWQWNMNELPVSPGQEVTFSLLLKTKRGIKDRTRTIKIKLPTLEYLFARSEKNASQIIKKLGKMIQERKRLLRSLGKRELRSKEWQRKRAKQLRKIYRKQLRQLKQLEQKMQEQQDRLSGRKLLSPETVRKIAQARAFLQKLQRRSNYKGNPKFNKLLKRFAKYDRARLKAIEKNMLRDLKRLLAAMKRMELLRRLEAAKSLVKSLREQTRKVAWRAKLKRSFKGSAALLKKMKQRLASLAKERKLLLRNRNNKGIRTLLKKMGKSIEQAKKQLEKMKRNYQSSKLGGFTRQLSLSLQKLEQALQKSINQYKNNRAQDVVRKLRKMAADFMALYDMLTEGFKRYQRNNSFGSDYSRKVALQDFLSLLGAVQKVIIYKRQEYQSLRQASLQKRGQVLQRMKRFYQLLLSVISRAQNKRPQYAYQRRMLFVANNRVTAALLKEQAKMVRSARKSRSQQQGSQQNMSLSLKALAQEQAKLDAALQKLLRKAEKGTLSAAEKRFLQQLALQQQIIRHALQKLGAGQAQNGKLLGSMRKLLSEMKKIEKALSQKKLSRKLVRQEHRLLQRLKRAARGLSGKGLKGRRKAEFADQNRSDTGARLKKELKLRRLEQQYRFFSGSKRFSLDERRVMRRYYLFLLKKLQQKRNETR